jgi:nitrate/TMAO reductase-like tetraheme cytochrome c subunit
MSNTGLRSALAGSIALLLLTTVSTIQAAEQETKSSTQLNYDRARYDPIHFRPAVEKATNEQCLSCHKEIIDRRVLDQSPAGVKAAESLAWYQTLNTYEGSQETFHRRHLETPMAKQLMNMQCTTCHQGNDPREEAPIWEEAKEGDFALRKMVNPDTCLMCHGEFGYPIMGLPGPWTEVGETMGNSCLTCHAAIRTNRHQVNYLKPEAIEQAGSKDADVCYGCHGGRAWYRIGYPYPRHKWPGMAEEIPGWAKGRPSESDRRFLVGVESNPQQKNQTQ